MRQSDNSTVEQTKQVKYTAISTLVGVISPVAPARGSYYTFC